MKDWQVSSKKDYRQFVTWSNSWNQKTTKSKQAGKQDRVEEKEN
jgi:hypothetical protein